MRSAKPSANSGRWSPFKSLLARYLVAIAGVGGITAFIRVFQLDASVSNVSMIYLLSVALSALYVGRGPAIFSSFLAFVCFDWFFVNPKHTLTVKDPSEWLALCMFLFSAILIGQLTAALQARAEEARKHQREAAALAEARWAERELLMKNEARAAALEEADRLKTALLSMVSHDFRSPLTSIKASVSTMLQDGSPLDAETAKGLLQAVDQETDRLNRMVGNILDLSRLEANAWKPRTEPTAVSELIGMSLDSFSVEGNARVVVKLANDLPEVLVDSAQVAQVIKNVVENALKYSPANSIVEIEVVKENEYVVLQVLDRGSGLPADADQMFKPFWRAPELHESSTPGVGIGLAIARGLAEANGGMLSAKNRSGGGCNFRVSLPVVMPKAINASTNS
jgi:two-component system sensor histidine kinase KdpD